jgi:hypothetical protein
MFTFSTDRYYKQNYQNALKSSFQVLLQLAYLPLVSFKGLFKAISFPQLSTVTRNIATKFP